LPRWAYLPLNTSAFLFLFLDMPQLNVPPRLFPCLRFAVHLAMPNAKLGAKVDRYSFLVRILHSLLHTGLARRTNISISLIDLGPQENNRRKLKPFGRNYIRKRIPRLPRYKQWAAGPSVFHIGHRQWL